VQCVERRRGVGSRSIHFAWLLVYQVLGFIHGLIRV